MNDHPACTCEEMLLLLLVGSSEGRNTKKDVVIIFSPLCHFKPVSLPHLFIYCLLMYASSYYEIQ